MIGLDDTPLGGAAEFRFAAFAHNVSQTEHRQFEALLPERVRRARLAARHWDFCAPANEILQLVGDVQAFPAASSQEGKVRLQKAAIARLVLGFFQVEDAVPAGVIQEYGKLWPRISSYVEGLEDDYPYEYFAKDVRFALGLTVPCGTLAIDLHYRIGPKLIGRAIANGRTLAPGFDYLRSRGWGRWYNDHMDTRDLREFNPAGWTASFLLFAQMLALNPAVRGVTGVSWFYDPAVCQISPNLAYIQKTQLQHGAFNVRLGTSAVDIKNATTRSKTRQKLYEAGAYMPTSYLLAWPRRGLIDWARSAESDQTRRFEAWRADKTQVDLVRA